MYRLAGIRFLSAVGICVCVLTWFAAVGAAWAQPVSRQALADATLINAWLAYPRLADVSAPYAFLRSAEMDEAAQRKRQTILKELDNLTWRLGDAGYSGYVDVIDQWRRHLEHVDVFRIPGRWDLAWLMAHPNHVPPANRVTALGSCVIPRWVEVWDQAGIHRYPWARQSTMSELLERQSIDAGPEGRISVVSPDGDISSYGIQAWNFRDTSLAPGARLVVGLPLSGDVFPWLRKNIAQFLAYTPAGEDCRSLDLVKEAHK